MADALTVFCTDEGKNYLPTMTKEQILTAITQAVSSGTIQDVDTGFVTTIVDQNTNKPVKLWVGTEAQFNALTEKDDDTLYIYTTTFEEDTVAGIAALTESIAKIVDGRTVVANATNAESAKKIEWEILYSNAVGMDVGEITLNEAIADGDLLRVLFDGEYKYFQVTNPISVPVGWNAFDVNSYSVSATTGGVNILMYTCAFTCTVGSATANVTRAYVTTIKIGSNGEVTGEYEERTHDQYTILPTVKEVARIKRT